ncbi:hypothetical protein K469DRAFT_695108 [Zopfia rhizophila CBS 207.26]|uniref:Uncharacterized protein n=1 Tax=Zopfia rhizophila CBS 207.26 TaxID=1314779 RepID=A0A6A6DMB9_9PEZI|nr:hypothetical protein K469DRAFT_695108 [Zopfia rhizophila CBS 207.26]
MVCDASRQTSIVSREITSATNTLRHNAQKSSVNSAVASGDFLGTPVTFNVDPLAQSDKDKFNRATTCLIVLQSFNGTRGVGCPAASAPTILNQQKHFANLLERDLSHGS